MIDEPKTYDLESIPDDAVTNSGRQVDFTPLDPVQFYQVEVVKAELRDNPYYNERETDPAKKGSKYQIAFEFAILNDGEFYGRRLWKNTSLAFMPTTKRGEPSILYKIINSALDMKLDWDGCASFAPDTKTLMKNIAEQVLGSQLIVSIENVENPDSKKISSKISSYNPAKKKLTGFSQEKSSELGKKYKDELPNLNKTLDDVTDKDLEDFDKFLTEELGKVDEEEKKSSKKKGK